MLVIHNDAVSIHLVSDALTIAVTGIGNESPRLSVCSRAEGTVSELWAGTLIAARKLARIHKAAVPVRHVMATYVDSGALDTYRASHGQDVPILPRMAALYGNAS